MKKLKIYLDTSVISFVYADDAPELRKITEKFFEDIGDYEVYISKERRINLVNQKQGYFYPFRMVSPLEVMGYEK